MTGFLRALQFSFVSIIQIIFYSRYFYMADAEKSYQLIAALNKIPICPLLSCLEISTYKEQFLRASISCMRFIVYEGELVPDDT